MFEQLESKQETFQVFNDPKAPSAYDYRKGFVTPELAAPGHPVIEDVAKHISRPRFVLKGLEQYKADQQFDLASDDVKAHRLRTVASHHINSTLAEMKAGLKTAQSEFQKLESKRLDAHKPPSPEVQNRLNQIRTELQAMESSERIKHVGNALRSNDAETLHAIASFPLNEKVCPRQYHWQCVAAHEANHMGEDSIVHQDLLVSLNALERSIASLEMEAAQYGAVQQDAGEAIYQEAMKANFAEGE